MSTSSAFVKSAFVATIACTALLGGMSTATGEPDTSGAELATKSLSGPVLSLVVNETKWPGRINAMKAV